MILTHPCQPKNINQPQLPNISPKMNLGKILLFGAIAQYSENKMIVIISGRKRSNQEAPDNYLPNSLISNKQLISNIIILNAKALKKLK